MRSLQYSPCKTLYHDEEEFKNAILRKVTLAMALPACPKNITRALLFVFVVKDLFICFQGGVQRRPVLIFWAKVIHSSVFWRLRFAGSAALFISALRESRPNQSLGNQQGQLHSISSLVGKVRPNLCFFAPQLFEAATHYERKIKICLRGVGEYWQKRTHSKHYTWPLKQTLGRPILTCRCMPQRVSSMLDFRFSRPDMKWNAVPRIVKKKESKMMLHRLSAMIWR